jgi:RHS repeat-associated protein
LQIGFPFAESAKPEFQPYKYNGKELDNMNGLNWYDYAARHYDPAVIRFTSMDPLAEKYYSISPYAYCANNPIKYKDPDGLDGMVTGSGTREDPYLITANYYYQNGSLDKAQVKGLSSAIESYNKSGGKDGVKVKNADGSTSYVKYNLSAQGVDDVGKAIAGDIFTSVDGQDISYGNRLGTEPNNDGHGEEFGYANGWRVDINPANIDEGIANGFNSYRLIESTYIHEIGHNLGLDHGDNTSMMQNATTIITSSSIGSPNTTYSYPSIDKKGVQIMINRINVPRAYPLGIIRTRE